MAGRAKLLVLIFALVSAAGTLHAGERASLEERGSLSPTMAKFYSVDATGEARDAGMSVDAIGTRLGKPPRKNWSRKAKSKRVKKSTGTPDYQITVTRKPANKRDARAEWQCERNGFYYTSDGRCVAPARSGVRQIR